ncbi:carboxylating nicotinate-nucleotide diphosphorylase [Pedobacter deserti]|uniref:carboxylating nicotinate-nucleotide diphosphorylase n=1 Tax=Pedobacter deserti TaxID=2817382 RepID=UPI00210B12E0|nr:carboxylating nicotinate-nucleotide diphosphorylase [Pedobacter sp. SYSU D00382]
MDKQIIDQFVRHAISEDQGDGDHTSLATIPGNTQGRAKLLVKESGVIAGVELALSIFHAVDEQLIVEAYAKDGDKVAEGDVVLVVSGNVQSILLSERLVLNCMQRMSGIATITRDLVNLLEPYKTKLLDTRKTTPGFRYFEKWAVRIGGGVNHRTGLYDMILIKDNHVDFAGGIKNAIESANDYLSNHKKQLEVEIEVRNLMELSEVLAAGSVDRIMLDNFNYADLTEAVNLIGGRYITEASGGITRDNLVAYAACGVDYISMGALTHSVKSLDLSLKAF